MNNQITAIGRLTAAPELRYTPQGQPVASFTVAYNDRRKNAAGEWEDGPAHFLDVQVWRQLAESAAELQKGQRVVVVGELKSRRWETREGEARTSWQVEAEEVGVLLDRFAKREQGAGWSKDRAEAKTGRDPWATAGAADTEARNEEPPFLTPENT